LTREKTQSKKLLKKLIRRVLDAAKALEENKANISKAEDESRKIIEQSRSYAEKLKEQMLNESKVTAAENYPRSQQLKSKARKDSAFNELKTQVAEK
jgi:F-type H+-transporting ATPase subunit b